MTTGFKESCAGSLIFDIYFFMPEDKIHIFTSNKTEQIFQKCFGINFLKLLNIREAKDMRTAKKLLSCGFTEVVIGLSGQLMKLF